MLRRKQLAETLNSHLNLLSTVSNSLPVMEFRNQSFKRFTFQKGELDVNSFFHQQKGTEQEDSKYTETLLRSIYLGIKRFGMVKRNDGHWARRSVIYSITVDS